MAVPDAPPVYLVELMDPHLEHIQKVDITAYLANAIEMVYAHLADFSEKVAVEVTINEASGNLAGIVFFNEGECAISVIRAYYLQRDELDCPTQAILDLAQGPLGKLEAALNPLFNKGKF